MIKLLWPTLRQTVEEAPIEEEGGDVVAWLVLGFYLLLGFAALITLIWVLVARFKNRTEDKKFEDRSN